jgi:hypothetical protein
MSITKTIASFFTDLCCPICKFNGMNFNELPADAVSKIFDFVIQGTTSAKSYKMITTVCKFWCKVADKTSAFAEEHRMYLKAILSDCGGAASQRAKWQAELNRLEG